MKQPVVLVLSVLGPVVASHGAAFSFDNLNTLVPDGKGSGLVNRQTLLVDQVSGIITDLKVSLTISGVGASGAFNGDLYATLQHDTGFAVLLNRPGRDPGAPWGYADNGLAVTFDDGGSAPDVHAYQLGGVPLGPLTGVWATDQRGADPSLVETASLRSAGLSLLSFHGLEASGDWTLFLADLELGGQARLDSWSLDITTGAVIPETGAWWVVSGLGLVGFALLRRRG